LVYFNNLFHKFEEIDASHDRRLSLEEFVDGCAVVGVPVDRGEAEREFAKMDGNDGGYVLFDEFCVWCARRAAPVADISELQPAPDPDKETATDSETEAEHLVRGGVAEKTRRLQQASKMSRIASAHTKSSRSRQKPSSGMGRTSTPLGNSLIGVSLAVTPRQQKQREMEELRRQQHEHEEHANQAKIAARARREER